jgi:hypothetical protein
LKIIRAGAETPIEAYHARKIPMVGYGKQEIINLCINTEGINYTDTILYIQNGDVMYANSDNINNSFDCFVSYRKFLEI